MAKDLPKAKASTQDHLDFEDITDDLVIFKTGWVALVIATTAVNFDLLSEAEQDATIYAYGAFLNSITFPMQTLIRSKKADITAYFARLAEAERGQTNPDLKRQIQKYQDFVQSIIQQKTVLDKKFYIIINFSPLELGFKGLGKKNVGKTKSKMQLLADAKASLFPRRDHIVKQLARLGITARQLSTKELIELFYDIYNPAPTGTQRVILDTASYTVPIVEPAVEIPTPAPTPEEDSSSAPAAERVQPQVTDDKPPQLASQPFESAPPLRPVPQQSEPEAIGTQVGNTSSGAAVAISPKQEETANTSRSADPELSSSQQAVLANLQKATNRAAQLVNQGQSTKTISQANGQPGMDGKDQ